MSETTNTPRLLPAAKEFNIGKETLIDFLQKKGFEVDLKPTSKLTPEMYYALQEEFAKDKAAKRKSEAIDLPKGVSLDNLNKSDEDLDLGIKDKTEEKKSSTKKVKSEPQEPTVEEPTPNVAPESPETTVSTFKPVTLDKETEEILKKNISAKVEVESPKGQETEPKEVAPKEIEEVVEFVEPKQQEVEKEIPTESVKPNIEIEKEEPKPETIPTEKTEEVKAEVSNEKNTTEVSENVQKEEQPVEHIETEVPVLKGPKIIDKIDLDSINMSTRPAKGNSKKKKEEEVKKTEHKPMSKARENANEPNKPKESSVSQTAKAEEVKKEAPVAQAPKVEETKEEASIEPIADDKPEHIELNVPRLAGPKILGKIELPVRNDNRSSNNKEKRKRKRIPVDKAPQGNNANNNNNDANKLKQGEHQDRNRSQQNRPQGQGGQRNDNRQQGNNNRPGAGQGNRNDRRNNHHNNRKNTQHQAPQEVDAKAIQDKIKETQAKLAGGVNAKLNKAKYRKTKREDMAERRAAAEMEEDSKPLQLTEFISVSELATLLDVPFTDVISKCMSLGIMVSINQRLDAEVIELVAGEFNREVEFINLQQDSDEEDEEDDGLEDNTERAPVITIMGHVDHGKTSLLDYIRNASVVAGEAGGITQHIGAYKVTTKTGKSMTFLDTPGHEAFTAMRARGAKAADIAIIVVAADDAIMPQTREAISHAQAAGLPMVFAINKIDKETANPEKIKEQLSAMNILVEDWGGKFQSQEISAKKGIGIDDLLEKILLEAELLELKANPEKLGVGSVIEASLDKGRGFVSTVLVQNGTLNAGDIIVSGPFYGKVKAMFNERGSRIKTAGPSTPVQVLGLNGAPQAGEKFKVYQSESDAKATANRRAQLLREQGIRTRKHITLDEIGRRLALGNFKELNVIIKGDVDGSVEALSDSLQKLSTEEILVSIVHKGVGQITESDVLLASASDAIIIGFQVRPSSHAAKVADQENIEIRYYSIIYDAINEIKSAMEGMLEPTIENKVVGNIEVREVYKISGVGTIAGCYVLDGKFSRNTKLNLIRDGIVIHHGELSSLKRYKDDVKEVSAGYECGLSIKNYNDIQIGDIIEGYEEIEIKRTLK
ncbi:MAG TPA: translation initiation factor IF-2 [Edaphocola sp.]|nr:translation initiation factor IF-2 [Edaphocola sp.]